MINICFLFGLIEGILFNLSKTCYFCTNVFSKNNDVHFDMGGIAIDSSNALKYFGLQFIMKKCL